MFEVGVALAPMAEHKTKTDKKDRKKEFPNIPLRKFHATGCPGQGRNAGKTWQETPLGNLAGACRNRTHPAPFDATAVLKTEGHTSAHALPYSPDYARRLRLLGRDGRMSQMMSQIEQLLHLLRRQARGHIGVIRD